MSTDVDATTPIGGVSPDGQECPSTEPQPCGFPDGVGDVINITSAGFTPTIAIRALFGMWFIPRLGGALGIRYQPDAGQGSMSHFMIYGRLQYLLTPPAAVGIHASVFAGAGGGQIQPKPDLMGAATPDGGERYVIAGLGAAFVGGSIGYRFVRNFGLWAEAEIDVLFPTTLLNIDMSAGVGVYF
ncbi:MAG: hypothetical protein HUU21_13390 [Polyangiaceae bacterium]|nr:hypothetical protein [Polyangiaceae bacterium]